MNKRIILSVLLLALPCLGAHAQAPANTTQIAAEGATVASTTGANVAYYWGSGATYIPVLQPVTYPLILDCAFSNPKTCPQLGGDPTPGVAKKLYAVEQATPYTVTLSDGSVVPVPALATAASAPPAAKAATVPCPLPTTANVNATIPATPPNCQPYPGGVAVATDGQMVFVSSAFAVVYFQYCQSSVCGSPFQPSSRVMIVGSNSDMGGSPGGAGPGTLYLLPSTGYVGLEVASGPINAISIAATNISK